MNVLLKNDIYPVSLDDYEGCKGLYLVYAPVAGNMAIANGEECRALDKAIADPAEAPEEMKDMINVFMGGTPVAQRDSKVNDVDEFLLMYVLPNFICNFSCSYCFSAKGRSGKILEKEHLKVALDYFVDSKRVKTDRLAITYLGGGEPIMSWDIVRFGIEYADRLAKENGVELLTTIVTNGSLITPEMVSVFNKYHVKVRVSFEILEQIQQKQRGRYAQVCQGLDLLKNNSSSPMVRSMITPDNVLLMCKMIEQLHQRFPFVREVLFDPITSSETFHEVGFTREFYDNYFREFLSARELAKSYGINLACAPLRNLNMVVERFCTGEFCLTPEGTITVCHQVSSPKEKNYETCTYAYIDQTHTLRIDSGKFKRLTSTHTIYSNSRCAACFIKWNCGGGCMMKNIQYADSINEVICDFTRKFSLALLLERLDEQYREEGTSLKEVINSYKE